MEQLREYLLKNEWVRDGGIPSLTYGELAPTSTSYLDKWLADFESKTLNPVSGFEENKDGNTDYIAKISMPIEKQIPQLEKGLYGQGWSVTKKSSNQITVVKAAEFTPKNDVSTASKPVNTSVKDTNRKTEKEKKKTFNYS
ncbi:hypothetical protein LOTGIDRAFT_153301 [Lottia gigantea]|uniref:Uncharacterized protein n=1 Tax=Lottia gigantea TaxID=225164 RepID=V3ZQZ9_LOTGI|nr:hypothetical protein LOTGIDRAFT_153301 [Lottia gigantea]ESO93828.1 hypothetical protein LOTGIDRAFT_153301 [Lottia gigantea]